MYRSEQKLKKYLQLQLNFLLNVKTKNTFKYENWLSFLKFLKCKPFNLQKMAKNEL